MAPAASSDESKVPIRTRFERDFHGVAARLAYAKDAAESGAALTRRHPTLNAVAMTEMVRHFYFAAAAPCPIMQHERPKFATRNSNKTCVGQIRCPKLFIFLTWAPNFLKSSAPRLFCIIY
jgi:hypothetical protein